jgi:hypothetical protein
MGWFLNVFNGKSQTKMDDDWGYPYFFVNLHGDLFEIAERNTD